MKSARLSRPHHSFGRGGADAVESPATGDEQRLQIIAAERTVGPA